MSVTLNQNIAQKKTYEDDEDARLREINPSLADVGHEEDALVVAAGLAELVELVVADPAGLEPVDLDALDPVERQGLLQNECLLAQKKF